jgi:epidermal growth factor receptor substrate 15
MEAAAFMKTSQLSELILSQIWELADTAGKGYLDKQTFSVAMKLIAVAQTGQDPTPASLTQSHPPPNMVQYSCAA